MATDYGKRLKQARQHAGLTQMQAQKLTGIRQSTISTAEREGRGSSDTPVYAKKYGVDALWLATGEGLMIQERSAPETRAASHPVISGNTALAKTLENLSSYLVEMDATTRHRAGFLLADLADNPDHHAQIAAMLEAAAAPKVPVKATATDEDSRRLVVWSEQFRAEQQRKQDLAKRKRKEG